MKINNWQLFFRFRFMPKIRKVNRKIQKHFLGIGILLFFILMFFVFYFFHDKISKNINDLIISFSAIIAAFFMYLTFRESRISNEITNYEADFNRLKQKIANNQSDLSKPIIIFINGSHPNLDNISYRDFFIKLFNYITDVKRKSDCRYYFELLKEKDNVDFDATSNLQVFEIINELQVVRNSLLSIKTNFIPLLILVNEIDSSGCHFLRRKALISEVSELYNDYYSVIYSYYARDTFYDEVLNPELLEYESGKLLKTRKCEFDDFSEFMLDVRYKTEKYLES
jgi:hypothetical protein